MAAQHSNLPALPLNSPHVINLLVDAKEREYLHSWTMAHFGRLLRDFHDSVAREPLIPAGAPLDADARRSSKRQAAMNKRLLAFALAACPALAAHAVEGGVGRSITGLQVTNYAGVVPPEPGWSIAAGYIYYDGQIGRQREVPIIGAAALGLESTFGLSSVTGVYVWDTGPGRWNFASMATLPYAEMDVTAGLQIGRFRRNVSDTAGGLYDASFAPIIAGYHFDETRHLSLALYVSAPTGDFDPDRLANPSLNVWVYSPTVSYTHLLQSDTLEWSTSVGVDLSTKNDDTNYESGAVFHVDTLLVKSFANGWGIGGVAGWITQVTDDSGPLADRLDGFSGHALAAGPAVTYQRQWGNSTLAVSFRWLKEFDVSRRTEGDPIMLTASVTF